MASFIEEGTFDLMVGEGRWRAKPGDVMLSHPGMRFRAAFQGRGFNDTCLSLTYLGASEDGFDATESWAKRARPLLSGSNRLRYLHWGLKRAIEANAPMIAEYCASEIFRAEPAARETSLSDAKFAWYAERVHAAREHLDARFGEAHTVSALARSVGMSMFHFTRVFTELVGRPPHAYLGERRLAAAHAMLREGRSVTETCFACGFNNLSHFTRRFASRYGVQPSRIAA